MRADITLYFPDFQFLLYKKAILIWYFGHLKFIYLFLSMFFKRGFFIQHDNYCIKEEKKKWNKHVIFFFSVCNIEFALL